MADSGTDGTTVPIKVTEPEKGAPPTLAEPASGPVAEMSGALAPATKSPSAAAEAKDSALSTPPTGLNGSAPSVTPSDKPADDMPVAAPNISASVEDTEMNDAPDADSTTARDATSTPAGKKAVNGKRKSVGGVPEHKNKKLNKKKSMPKITHLDAQPGEYYFARLKSYPPWPSMICDEEMLPSSLLNSRPLTTKQADGMYKEAYADGGKKVMDRTFPVMFLYTNEFAWIPNTDLTPLDPAECKDPLQKGKSKPLLAAYEVAAKGHDISHFKSMLADHANALQEEADRIATREAEKAEKAAKAEKKKRKSEVKATTEDVDMADADGEPKKASKKRKKGAESDDEQTEKPVKTPKTTKIKLTTAKTPTTTEKKPKEPKSAKPKSEKKKKAAAQDEAAQAVAAEPKPLDPVEERKAREKEVLFLRHKLQKGFLSREQSPREDEMPQMSDLIKKLEAYPDLEVAIIRVTKINKVLKALVKLNTIPRDEEFHFRSRSVDLLSKWNKILGAEPEGGAAEKDKASLVTNGVHDEKKTSDKPVDSQQADSAPEMDKQHPPATNVSKPAETTDLQPTVSDAAEEPMAESKAATPAVEKAPESAAAAAQVHEIVRSTE